uniref:asparaginase n=1 Tax=Bionectria ochroleuca TaxID=29856 RepID=A0A0B7JWA3_BIOOC
MATPSSAGLPESRVLIIGTGGTICMQEGPDGLQPSGDFLESAMAPRPTFNDMSTPRVTLPAVHKGKQISIPSLRTPPTAYQRHVRYGIVEFSPLLDSSSMNAQDWADIAISVKENYHLYDGFVILHGTDSLAYTASALSFIMSNLGKPVILTGSQAPIFALQSDAPLAKVNGLGIEVNWPLTFRPTTIAEFDILANIDTTHVACLRVFPGIKPEMVDAVLRLPDLRGLILETFGMGNQDNIEAVLDLLDGDGRNLIKQADYAGNTAIHLVAVSGNADIMRALLQRGASVHERNRANISPLLLATLSGNDACAQLLRTAGAHMSSEELERKLSN